MHTHHRVSIREACPALFGLAFVFFIAAGLIAQSASSPVPPLDETGFKQIFDGKTLDGWDCDPEFWRVQDDAIVGETKLDHQPKQNTFCIWKGGSPGKFRPEVAIPSYRCQRRK